VAGLRWLADRPDPGEPGNRATRLQPPLRCSTQGRRSANDAGVTTAFNEDVLQDARRKMPDTKARMPPTRAAKSPYPTDVPALRAEKAPCAT
jgi:hypothetical protein